MGHRERCPWYEASRDELAAGEAFGLKLPTAGPRSVVVRATRALRLPAERRARGQVLLEGPQVLETALAHHARIDDVLICGDQGRLAPLLQQARSVGARIWEVDASVVERVATTRSAQGVVAVCADPLRTLAEFPSSLALLTVLAGVQDPGNAGAIVRVAAAAGADGVVSLSGGADLGGPKALRASAGAVFQIPVASDVSWPTFRAFARDRGLLLVGADAHGGDALSDVVARGPCALVLGSEGLGLSSEVDRDLDARVRLPLANGVESLNVASAAAVLLFSLSRRVGVPGEGGIGGEESLAGDAWPMLLASLGHNVRSPLTAIGSAAALLRDRWDDIAPRRRAEVLDIIVHEAEQIGELATEVSESARVAIARMELRCSTFALADLVATVIAKLRRWGIRGAQGLCFEVKTSAEDPVVSADAQRIALAVSAMLQWGLDHGDGEVQVACGRTGDRAWVSATDRGSVSDRELAAALRWPAQLGAAGSGLGMWLAGQVASLHGGALRVERADGGNTTVVLELPLVGDA